MRFNRNGKPVKLLWALCIICTLLSGICFDNTAQTDSCLAYGNAENCIAGYAGGTLFCNSPVDAAVSSGTASFRASQRGVPAQQAYIPEYCSQGSAAILPGRSAQRTGFRSVWSGAFGIFLAGILFSLFFFGQKALFFDGLCEIISNTVILQYIHGQDGEKA